MCLKVEQDKLQIEKRAGLQARHMTAKLFTLMIKIYNIEFGPEALYKNGFFIGR